MTGNCNDWYAADYMRFGCGHVITATCSNGQKANLKIEDGGPGCSVENNAGGQVIDASYSMCKLCTGGTSCGWSDHFKITVTWSFYYNFNDEHIDKQWLQAQLGPCSYDPIEIKEKGLAQCLGDMVMPPTNYSLPYP